MSTGEEKGRYKACVHFYFKIQHHILMQLNENSAICILNFSHQCSCLRESLRRASAEVTAENRNTAMQHMTDEGGFYANHEGLCGRTLHTRQLFREITQLVTLIESCTNVV